MSLYDQFQQEQSNNQKTTGGLYAQYVAEKTPQPSTVSKVVGAVKNYAQESAQTVDTFGNAILHPLDTLKKAQTVFTDPLIAGEQKAGEGLYDTVAGKGVATKVAGVANLISGIAQAAFSPVTGLFTIAENTPGLKQVADTLNIPFTATGFAGSWATGKAIDWIPNSILPASSKAIIKQPLQEVGALAGQLVLGGKIMEKIAGDAKTGKPVTPERATEIVNEAKAETADHPAVAAQAAPAGGSMFEQYKQEKVSTNGSVEPVSNTETPLVKSNALDANPPELQQKQTEIDMLQNRINENVLANKNNKLLFDREGRVVEVGDAKSPKQIKFIEDRMAETGIKDPKEFVSKVQSFMEDKTKLKQLKADFKDMKRGTMSAISDTKSLQKMADQSVGATEEVVPPAPGSAGYDQYQSDKNVARVTKASSDINTQIATRGFDAMKPEELATFDPITKADQIQKVVDIMDKSIERAKAIATGKEAVPYGIHSQVLFNAVEQHALQTNDIALLQELAKSPIATQLSSAGQTLGAHGFNDNPNSPVRIIQDVVKAREDAVEKSTGQKAAKAKSDVIRDITKEIKKSAPTKQTWSDFVESIKCGY